MTRTDPHCPSNFKPSDYRYAFAFAGAHSIDGWPIPPFNMEMAIHAMRSGRRPIIPLESGDPRGVLHCDVCGAHFIHGEAWEHAPTGEIVFLGHTCAAKYEMHASDPAFERAIAGHRSRVIRRLEMLARIDRARRFLRDKPELRAAMRSKHRIVRDLVNKTLHYGDLSEKQVALAIKIAREERERAKQDEIDFAEIPATAARMTVQGRIIAAKWKESFRGGEVLKALVAAELPDGRLIKVWGTVPRLICDRAVELRREEDLDPYMGIQDVLRNRRVRFVAKVERSRDDARFGFWGRPTGGEIVRA